MKHIFFHYESINPVARKGFNPSKKKRGLSGNWKNPSGHLWISHSPDSLIIAIVHSFLTPSLGIDCCHVLRTSGEQKSNHEDLFVVEAEWTVSRCTLNNVYLLYQGKKKKILKSNINHLKAKKFIICFWNLHSKKILPS